MANNTVHTITLSGYTATTEGNCWALQLGTWNSYGIEQIQLALGPEWEGLVITATFTPPKGSAAVKVVVDSSGLFDVPQEATALAGQGAITFAGNTSGQQRISVDVPYAVANHAAVDGVTPTPTPSEWAQFVAQVQQARDDAEAASQAAEGSQTAAAGSASAAAESAQEAQNIVDGAVQDIATAKDAAVQAVNDAGNTAVQAVQAAQTTAVGAVNAAGDAKIEQLEQINALVPTPTPEDAGKVVVVKPDGTGYEFGDAGSEIDDTVVATDTTWSSLNIVNKLCPPFLVTGDTVQFTPVEGYPLSVQSAIVATQSGEGDPSPENVRPIVPVEQVGAWVGGKNLFSFSGQVTIPQGIYAYEATEDIIEAFNKLPRNVEMCLSAEWTGYALSGVHQQIRVYLGSEYTIFPTSATATIPFGEVTQVLFYGGRGKTQDCVVKNIQLEVGSATAYGPYRGQFYTAPLNEPCYGGTVDLTGGTGEVDYFKVEISDPSTVYMGDGSTIFYTTLNLLGFADAKYNPAQNVASSKLFICDRLKPAQNVGDTSPYGEVAIFENGIIRMKVDGVTSQQGARDWITANPVTLAYKLATPTPFTITPLSIHAPASPATAYSTAGEITVSGRSDPIEYINQQIANAIAIAKA